MPIYAYKCPSCGKEFEKLVSLSRRDEGVECPDCGQAEVRRSVASFAAAIGGSSSSGGYSGGGGCGSGGFT
jgi:putative FmdB family regulatory protein